MTQALTDCHPAITCYRCGKVILPGEGRYNVFPDESYCSWTCLHAMLPEIAEAIRLFVREPRQPR